MTGMQLKTIREKMALTQAELADRLKVTRNSVARMERDEMIVTPPMALLISFVAREAGIDPTDAKASRRAAPDKGAHCRTTRNSSGKGGRRSRS
jgi:transcriptional regulator with XRE-family HTH domain